MALRRETDTRRPAAAGGMVHELVSPVSGEVIDHVRLCSRGEIATNAEELGAARNPISRDEAFAFLARLRDQMIRDREELVESSLLETGFVLGDSRDLVDGAIDFLRDFARYVDEQPSHGQAVRHSYAEGEDREMHLLHRPFHCIAALVPQNASLPLSITIIASALAAGARVILRPSLQCAVTGEALSRLVKRSAPPPDSVRIVNCLATDFLEVANRSEAIELIHYIGSNAYALDVFVEAFRAKKVCLLDGQGNGLLYVDRGFPVVEAVRLITSGATRFNGETCTSVNGVLAHPSIHGALREALVASFRSLRVGDPAAEATQIGPLFSAAQVQRTDAVLREGSQRLLCGGALHGAYFRPAVVEDVAPSSSLVQEGIFGPAVWIHPADESELFAWLRANRFPLSDTILSEDRELVRRFAERSRAARICVDADPSIESMFEPWGGYPPSGLNPVSVWVEKYRQAFQLDGPERAVRRIRDGAPPERRT